MNNEKNKVKTILNDLSHPVRHVTPTVVDYLINTVTALIEVLELQQQQIDEIDGKLGLDKNQVCGIMWVVRRVYG